MRLAFHSAAAILLSLCLSVLGHGAFAEDVSAELAPAKGAEVDVSAPDTDGDTGSDEVTADEGEDEKKKEDEVVSEKMAPSDGSEDGERLPGLDSMGKVQSGAEYAGTSGELKYTVELMMPKFRDLEPKVGMVYNSHNMGRAGAEAVMGPGWTLKGFSSIERVSALRGAPTYESGKDILLLDGMEMLKCNGNAMSIAGASTAYATSHVKSNASVGCSAGGDFTTLNETYFRIKYNAAANQFELMQKNGVKFIYQSIHALAPSATVAGDAYKNMRERRKWLLTRIEDTQSNANDVTFRYKFDTTGKAWYWQGFPERPHRIEYAGYVVEFHYAQQTNPVATFTTGTQYRGRQYQLLEAVSINYGSTKIRAYDLAYTTAPVTGTKLLRVIKPIGNNYVVNANGSVSGSDLPAWRFEYDTTAYSTTNRWHNNFEAYVPATKVHNGVHGSTASHGAENGETFHSSIHTVETNGDGIDEILALDVKPNGEGNPHYRERSGHFTFDINGNMTRNTAAYAIPTGRFSEGGSYWTFLGMNRWTPEQSRPMAIRGRFYNDGDRRYLEANPLTAGWYNNRQVEGARAEDRVHWLTGNFDDDPELEVMIRDSIYDVAEQAGNGEERFPKKSLSRTTHPRCTGRTWTNARVVDVNADGIDDVFGA